MTHGNSTYFRSKSLNDEWEDLSQSVSCVLKVHKGPEFNKAETSSQTITTTHWVEAIERTHCSERNCGKKFSLTVRKHHCRRCAIYLYFNEHHYLLAKSEFWLNVRHDAILLVGCFLDIYNY